MAVRAESVSLIDLLWKHLNNQIRILLDEKNYNGERPVDVSEEIRCTTCTTRLREIYRITSQAHLSVSLRARALLLYLVLYNLNSQELPPPPPIPHIPELEVLQSVEAVDLDEDVRDKVDKKPSTRKKNIRKVEHGAEDHHSGQSIQYDHSQSFSPLGSEEDYSRVHNSGYIDLNGMIAAEQKKSIFDSKMILAITCSIALVIFVISCVCLLKK